MKKIFLSLILLFLSFTQINSLKVKRWSDDLKEKGDRTIPMEIKKTYIMIFYGLHLQFIV